MLYWNVMEFSMFMCILMAHMHMMFEIRLTIGFYCIDNKMCFYYCLVY